MDRLAQRRLRVRSARPVVFGGERSSESAGSGIEFAEHRPYQPGDDLRHLDHNVYARIRAPYVKTYAAERGMNIALIVDKTRSMSYGDPRKVDTAVALATGLSCAALGGGDRLRVGVFGGDGHVELQRAVTGIGRLRDAVAWLGRSVPAGRTDLPMVARRLRSQLTTPSLTVVVSDWWSDEPHIAVRELGRNGHEVVVVHVLSEQELEPLQGIYGSVRVQDVETGSELEVAMDGQVLAAYRRELEAWQASLRAAVDEVGGQYLSVRSDDDEEQVLLQRWADVGFIA